MTGLDYAIVGGFLLAMALAGFAISRLIKDSDDFFVAGRELTPFILCATITATNLSMLHFVGMGGTAYKHGVSILWQNWTGDIALVLSGIFVIPLMRRLRIRSVPEFLEMRYSRGLRTLVGAFWGVRLCVFLGILLYIAATSAIIITGSEPTRWNYILWLLAFSLVSILYSVIGGAWAVAIMDSFQFLVMLAGALVILPIATRAAGGVPEVFRYLRETGRDNHLQVIPLNGDFNWLFITSIMLLGFKFASIDQAILQRAFGARSPRIAAQGMILSAIVTTPFAFFWVLPGLAAVKLHPEPFANPDHAIPWLLAHTLPPVATGLLGFVLCGMLAAQVSTITADVNSVATLFTSDVYRTLRRREPTQRELLFVVRLSSLLCGLLMLAVAYLLRNVGVGAVKINLTVVGILDMPLFVITILYGLLWKRANWQGAVAGFVSGGAVGLLAYYFAPAEHVNIVRNLVPIFSSATAILVTPIVSVLTSRRTHEIDHIWDSFKGAAHVDGEDRDTFHFVPVTRAGKIGLATVIAGVVLFFAGVLSTPLGFAYPGTVALVGLFAVFVGGLVRVYSD